MKVFTAFAVIAAVIVTPEGAPQGLWDRFQDSVKDSYDFTKGAIQGAGDMADSYLDMRNANWRNSDKYFHARGNNEAAQRGPGGVWASRVISDARESIDQMLGDDPASSVRDQQANEWGRSGGDPNIFRPQGLPTQY